MGKKKSEPNSNGVSEPKEGHNLLGFPTFEPLENGRFRCVETGHELPADSRDSYARAKHCRLGLIDSALARNKPPLNMFQQDPSSRSKLICKLTGDTINKSEEHIWKHMTGKRFLSMLDKKESEKEMRNCTVEKQSEGKDEKKKKNEDTRLKKKRKKIAKEDKNVEEIIGDSMENGSNDLEDEVDFWMPPAGERWDHDDGGDRWGSGSESDDDVDDDDDDDDDDDASGEEATVEEDEELSKQTKRMSLEIGPSSFASRKKKMKKDVA